MSVVIDASCALAWIFDDEAKPVIDELFANIARAGASAPAIWRLEVANGLRMAIRRGRTVPAFRDAALERLRRLPIDDDDETAMHAWDATLRLSDRYDLTPYDAAYLELAQRRRLPLATLDRRLAEAAAAADIAVWPLD